MRLHELLDDPVRPDLDPEIRALTDDSRRVEPGTLFIDRAQGKHLDEALARGAVAVLGAESLALPEAARTSVAFLRSANVPASAAILADRFAGEPSRKLRAIGVTGTNGKTTIAHLVQQLLQGDAPQRRCGLIGTVEVDDGRERRPSSLTTPGAVELAPLLAAMVRHGCTHLVMEVSSHALEQERVAALRFACAVFTNLTGDHLDYHGSMERYARAKARLFESLEPSSCAVVNVDDPWCGRVTATKAEVLRCSALDPKAECFVRVDDVDLRGMRVMLQGPWGNLRLRLPLIGAHNAMNALQAAAVAWTQGTAPEVIAGRLEVCAAPPGRLEPVVIPGAAPGFSVLVDYAHTDDALLNVLRAVRPALPEGGRVCVLFGCGGDRDRSKRPRMAEVACRNADEVIVTSDNPRTEDPLAIIAEILAGVTEAMKPHVLVEPDRAAAIELAIARARPGDVLVIAGKGHEDYQIIGREKRPFDDRKVAGAALERRLVAGAKP